MTDAQIALFRPLLLKESAEPLSPAALAILREHLRQPLEREGLLDPASGRNGQGTLDRPSLDAHDGLDRWIGVAYRLIQTFASHPFATQAALASELQVGRDTLVRLNRVVRNSDFAQRLIVEHGQATKYWQNTIVPLAQSGALNATRRHESRHPFRVGVYPGVSCMFHCSFCGRHHDARYASDTVAPGNELLHQMLRDAPADDPYVFYLSGGLEPLTNPGLGELVRAGAGRGFKLSLYTNGFMLTPQLLNKQPGLWDLDTLRISLYGANQASTTRVTRHDKAFEQVRRNAKTFLTLRNERGVPMKFGFNFVVLPGRPEEVLEVVELLAELNRDAGGERQVDFLTIREDYSVPADRGLSAEERERLVAVFAELETRCRRDDLRHLQIDVGYALHAAHEGVVGRPLEFVEPAEMRPTGYPQVSVVVDLLGDVYLYREAGFLERPGARRYIIGRVTPTRSLEQVVEEFLASGQTIAPMEGDTGFFDIFDHVVTRLLNQADADERFGVPFEEGPVRDRIPHGWSRDGISAGPPTLAHPTLPSVSLAHPTLANVGAR